jgi:hypothetical protein
MTKPKTATPPMLPVEAALPAERPSLPPLEGLIGSALTLMSQYATMPQLGTADAVARQLALLTRHPHAGTHLRELCTGLFLQWLGPVQTQDQPPAAQWRDVWPAPELTQ